MLMKVMNKSLISYKCKVSNAIRLIIVLMYAIIPTTGNYIILTLKHMDQFKIFLLCYWDLLVGRPFLVFLSFWFSALIVPLLGLLQTFQVNIPNHRTIYIFFLALGTSLSANILWITFHSRPEPPWGKLLPLLHICLQQAVQYVELDGYASNIVHWRKTIHLTFYN